MAASYAGTQNQVGDSREWGWVGSGWDLRLATARGDQITGAAWAVVGGSSRWGQVLKSNQGPGV